MFDARKKEVYTGLYRVDPVCVQLIPDCVTEPHRFVATITEPTVFIGDGAAFYRALIEQELGNLALFPPLAFNHSRASSGALLAAEMFARGEGGGVTGLKATYLRRSEAELAKIRKEI
jgi:tRNA threonylcarbamoyladenosine biosynthesis protein TsaB